MQDGSPDQGLVNLRWAHALADGLAAAGLARAVISPGSRSTPLVLALARHPGIDTRVHLDERGAAFLALGMAIAGGAPVALVATSGSGPAHWHPAVLEASLSRVPLILLSADRPPELRDWGANQTLDQQRLFGVQVRAFLDPGTPVDSDDARRQVRLLAVKAVEQSLRPRPGPVHINLPFREPLIPTAPEAQWPATVGAPWPLDRSRSVPAEGDVDALASELSGTPGVIVCGPDRPRPGLAPALVTLGRRLGAPLLADPLSGLRFGPHPSDGIISRYDAFLRSPDLGRTVRPRWVLRLGAAPVSAALQGWLAGQEQARHILVDPETGWRDPAWRADRVLRSDPLALCEGLAARAPVPAPPDWLARFRRADEIARADLAAETRDGRPFEGLVVRDLLRLLPADALLFCGNSLPIRQLDTWSGTREAPLRVVANRGASGIDGNLATLLGLAAAGAGPAVGLIGDLAFWHDLGSLAAARDLKITLVVLNNGGGGIFGQLPQAGLAGFERYWLTPQGLDLARAADLFGLGFRRVERQEAFAPALTEALAAPRSGLIEVLIDREYSLDRHRAYWAGQSAG